MCMPSVEFQLSGPYALFSDPVTRTSGQKCSYSVPTAEALKGALKNAYWKPTFEWYIDAVRVMNRIGLASRGARPIHYQNGGNDLAYYTYLEDVRYQVRAHFEWNENRPELAGDRCVAKHLKMARKAIARGGRRPVFLGTSECVALLEPCVFGSGDGAYDGSGSIPFGLMVHGITYPDGAYSEDTKGAMTVGMWSPEMVDGVIEFVRPEACPVRKRIRSMPMKPFGLMGDGEEVDVDGVGPCAGKDV